MSGYTLSATTPPLDIRYCKRGEAASEQEVAYWVNMTVFECPSTVLHAYRADLSRS